MRLEGLQGFLSSTKAGCDQKSWDVVQDFLQASRNLTVALVATIVAAGFLCYIREGVD